jgi:hypothetical protein
MGLHPKTVMPLLAKRARTIVLPTPAGGGSYRLKPILLNQGQQTCIEYLFHSILRVW